MVFDGCFNSGIDLEDHEPILKVFLRHESISTLTALVCQFVLAGLYLVVGLWALILYFRVRLLSRSMSSVALYCLLLMTTLLCRAVFWGVLRPLFVTNICFYYVAWSLPGLILIGVYVVTCYYLLSVLRILVSMTRGVPLPTKFWVLATLLGVLLIIQLILFGVMSFSVQLYRVVEPLYLAVGSILMSLLSGVLGIRLWLQLRNLPLPLASQQTTRLQSRRVCFLPSSSYLPYFLLRSDTLLYRVGGHSVQSIPFDSYFFFLDFDVPFVLTAAEPFSLFLTSWWSSAYALVSSAPLLAGLVRLLLYSRSPPSVSINLSQIAVVTTIWMVLFLVRGVINIFWYFLAYRLSFILLFAFLLVFYFAVEIIPSVVLLAFTSLVSRNDSISDLPKVRLSAVWYCERRRVLSAQTRWQGLQRVLEFGLNVVRSLWRLGVILFVGCIDLPWDPQQHILPQDSDITPLGPVVAYQYPSPDHFSYPDTYQVLSGGGEYTVES